MALRLILALLVLVSAAAADDLDDLDLGPPPSPAASVAPPAKVDDEDPFKDDPILGGKTEGPSVLEPVESAPSTLPGGLRDAWNLTAALAFLREHKLDQRPKDAPFKSWQALRAQQEITAILNGATDVPGPIKSLIEKRVAGLVGLAATLSEPILDDVDLDGLPATPRPAAPAAKVEAPALDEEVERLARKLTVLDRSDLVAAQDVARELATRAGDASVATRLAAAAVHGPDLVPFTDRVRTLVHAPPGAAWAIRQLASGDPVAVQAALDYVRDGAVAAEVREVLAAVAAGKVGESAAAQVIQSVGALGSEEMIAELDRVSAAGLGRAVGEAVGRIRQRAEELASWRDGSRLDRRETASRINQAALPLYKSGQYREALLKFRVACELDPAEATYRHNLGSALVRLGNVTEGLDHLKQAIALGRDEMIYYEATTSAMRDLGRRAELVSFLEERAPRVQYSAVVVLIYLNLAHEYVAIGRAQDAHQSLDIAFARSVPERYLSPLLARRGDAYMLTGEIANARRTYQRALEYSPDYRRAQDGVLRADAWQPVGGPPVPAPVAGPGPIDDGGLGLELDAPSPSDSGSAKPPPAPGPSAKPSPAADGLDDLEI